jgi:hypothetical protein
MTHSKNMAEAWFDAFRRKERSDLELADDFVHSSPYGDIEGRQAYLDLVA